MGVETKIVQAFVARTIATPKVWMQFKNLKSLGLQVACPAPINRQINPTKVYGSLLAPRICNTAVITKVKTRKNKIKNTEASQMLRGCILISEIES